ncbi:DUF2561 family protein [Mycolicibacterium sp. 050158]|uniref:DUF2561 family protein n=1 Tax=Mycolicibacterium sp. 050158 TaxID=3090602 RepID=UPI00299EC0AC|nr:DUF2561 family protein [Mycolicibacterium sp. 050158]MDX1893339.1 DUF2561 family protein [Mycolicibacterium sp. 050158]
MTSDIGSGVRTAPGRSGNPGQVDRILIIVCIAFWLTALGAAVASIVALVDLATAHTVGGGGSDTPWLLYTVIGVSAAVIIGAIPLLLRARQTATTVVAPRAAGADDAGRQEDRPSIAQRLQPFGAPVLRGHSAPPAGGRVGFPTAAVDQIWLRCSAILLGAIGAALTGIGIATYLMASGKDTASWIVYGVAAIIAVAMIAAPWFYLRQLREVLDASV